MPFDTLFSFGLEEEGDEETFVDPCDCSTAILILSSFSSFLRLLLANASLLLLLPLGAFLKNFSIVKPNVKR